jgi:hypothetical protein
VIDSPFVPLLDAVRGHLAEFDLSGGIHKVAVSDEDIWVQLVSRPDPAEMVVALLGWVDTVAAARVTALRWKTRGANDLRLTVRAMIADGAPLRVWNAVPYDTFGVPLAIGAEQEVPLDLLRSVAARRRLADGDIRW